MKLSLFGVCLAWLASEVCAAPSSTPVNPNASQAAKNLLAYLVKQSQNGITLSGQQDLESANWVTQNIGKTPAILGVDFMDYSPSRVAYGAKGTTVEDAISFSNAGGIITYCWHWGSPSGTINSASQPWYSNFYTAATTFDIAAAMNNPNGNDYQLILRDIDAIATQLKRLQSANIPILWRPLHEAEGGWFWWGAKGADACKKLYTLLFDRLTHYHGLNNLVWVWNSVNSNWYPGNSVVDIVTTDIYSSAGDHSAQQISYNNLKSLSGDTKLIALGEVGSIPDPVNTRPVGANWAYWVVWNGDFIKGTSYNPLQYKYNIFSSAYILTRDEISGWKG